MKKIWLYALIPLAWLALAGVAPAQWQEIAAADGSFSFQMPLKPKEQRLTGKHYNLPSDSLTYSTNTQRVGFLFAGRTNYHPDAKVPAREELRANAENFAKSLGGRLISQRFFSWARGPGDDLQAHESTLDSDRGTFRQLYVIDRNSVYGVIAGPKAGDNEADIERFFASLRITKR